MAKRKKGDEPEYITTTFRTNLVRISMQTGTPLEKLMELNPDIRFAVIYIPAGRKVRIG